MITIDTEKCQQDGLCAADCPTAVIRFEGKGRYPESITEAQAACLHCGHCVAVCPHGALSHADVPLVASPEIDKHLRISKAQAFQFLRSRRSVRRYKNMPVEPETIGQLIEIACHAPTGGNMQLVEWAVISDRDQLRTISEKTVSWMRAFLEANIETGVPPYVSRFVSRWDAGIDTVLWNAPCLVVAMTPARDRSGMVNLSLSLSYFQLAAPFYGLGTCWAGFVQSGIMSVPELKAVAGIPQDYPNHYPLMVGYPNVTYHRMPKRRLPKIKWL